MAERGFLPRSTRLFDEIISSGRVVLRCRKRQQTESRDQTGSALRLVNKNRSLRGKIKQCLFQIGRSQLLLVRKFSLFLHVLRK